MRTQREVEAALLLHSNGLGPTEIARLLTIPRSTVRDWCKGTVPQRPDAGSCLIDHLGGMDSAAYAYLLGMYLGDGCISRHRRGVTRLRITLDAAHPRIADECVDAIMAVAPGRRANVYRRRGQRAADVSNYWNHWPCLFPQHGAGAKHLRPIILADWQRRLVESHPKPLIRGLIHSDGTRFVATERKGSYVRRAPRYAFRNRSADILELFHWACESVGVHCTRASETQIAVYSKAAVALLDEFVGPKG